jgi:hypothetical protein
MLQPDVVQVMPSVLTCKLMLASRKPSPSLVTVPLMNVTDEIVCPLENTTPAASQALTLSPSG